MPLVNAIQPFASRRLAWLHREASETSAATRILGASSDENLQIIIHPRVRVPDWGLPRVKHGTGGCNLTLLAAEGGIGYIVKQVKRRDS